MFEINARKWAFRIVTILLGLFLFPELQENEVGYIATIILGIFVGDFFYKLYKRFFFQTAIVFDFHGVMVTGDLSLKNFTKMPGMWELVRFLRSSYKVGLLTNMNQEIFQMYSRKFGPESVFDFVYFSGGIGAAKPDKKVFQHVLSGMGVSAKNMIFIDDRADYLTGAKELGIRTIHFSSPEQCISELRKMGIKV
jgi:phosphoglycolate phosphatase-like HAD superfamily hydrolase